MNSAQMDQPTHKDIDKVRRQPTTVKRKHSGRSPARTIPTPQQDREIEPAQEAKGTASMPLQDLSRHKDNGSEVAPNQKRRGAQPTTQRLKIVVTFSKLMVIT